MLDINLVRENPELVKKNQLKADRKTIEVDEILKLDKKWREKKLETDKLRSKRNQISEEINKLKKSGDDKKAKILILEAKNLPNLIKKTELESDNLQNKRDTILKSLPNIISKQTPIGKDSTENVEIKKWGKPRKFSFSIKNHVELSEKLNIIGFEESAKVSGNGFYYLKNELAILNQALIRFTIDFMRKKKYEYIEPPLMIKKDILTTSEGMESLANSIYEKGLWRTHQFNKIEQFIFCKPEESEKYYSELMKNSVEILKALKLPFRIIELCTGDLAKWKYRSADFEVWRPTTKSYGEVMSLSNITDYQARDHNIRFLNEENKRIVIHTLNNTALATSRILVCILENNQNKDGSINIPTVLHKYTGFKKISLKN